MLIEIGRFQERNILGITNDEAGVDGSAITIEVDDYSFKCDSKDDAEILVVIKGLLKECGMSASSMKLR